MSDIYLSLTETPAVVTLSQPVIASSVAATVTVGNTVTVALDANSLSALENVTVTVGAAVSVSNFPSTQTIAGTVTANLTYENLHALGVIDDSDKLNCNVNAIGGIDPAGWLNSNGEDVPISGTVTVGNSVTIGSLPAISGTVNANVYGQDFNGTPIGIPVGTFTFDNVSNGIAVGFNGDTFEVVGRNNPFPIRGTVTIGNSVTIGSLPAISGTVTAAAPNGSLTTRFGTPTTANVSFATAAVTKSDRKYLLIQNVTTGSNVITVGIGFTPTTTQGIQLTAGAGITFESSYIPTGAVQILSSVTASNFTILEA